MQVHVPSAFYIFTGGILFLSGLVQLVLRLRADGVRGLLRPGTFFSLVSLGLGALVVYFGLYIHR